MPRAVIRVTHVSSGLVWSSVEIIVPSPPQMGSLRSFEALGTRQNLFQVFGTLFSREILVDRDVGGRVAD